MKFDISIIIVNYNSKDYLKKCLLSIPQSLGKNRTEIIVIDNYSQDGSVSMIQKNFPKIRLVRNRKNFGYNYANNQGLKTAAGNYILLLNPDTMMKIKAIAKMADYLKKYSKVAGVGPRQYTQDGKICWTAFSALNILDILQAGNIGGDILLRLGFSENTQLFLRNFIVNRKYLKEILFSKKPFFCEAVSGACFLIKKDVIDKIGPKDEKLFAFAEESDWGIKIAKLGLKIVYLPAAEIIHFSGGSSQNPAGKQFRIESTYHNRLYLTKKYFPSWLLPIRIYLFFELLTRTILANILKSDSWKFKKARNRAYYNSLKTIISSASKL